MKLKDDLNAVSISPLEALGYGEYEKVSLGEFIPLYFEKVDFNSVKV